MMDHTRDKQWGLSEQRGAATFSCASYVCILWNKNFIFHIWANNCNICLARNSVQSAFTPKPCEVSGFVFSPPTNPAIKA